MFVNARIPYFASYTSNLIAFICNLSMWSEITDPNQYLSETCLHSYSYRPAAATLPQNPHMKDGRSVRFGISCWHIPTVSPLLHLPQFGWHGTDSSPCFWRSNSPCCSTEDPQESQFLSNLCGTIYLYYIQCSHIELEAWNLKTHVRKLFKLLMLITCTVLIENTDIEHSSRMY